MNVKFLVISFDEIGVHGKNVRIKVSL